MPTALDVIANLTGAGITEAQAKTWFTAMRAAMAEMGDPLGTYGRIQNMSIVASVGSSALTVALKDRAGSDPAAASPVSIPFRNVTDATGDFSVINVTAASSLVISSGSTMGATSAKAFRLWLVGFNDGGTFRLGLVNCLSGASIMPLRDDQRRSSTAEGGAGGADSAQVIYTGTAVSSKAMRILGYLEWSSGLTTAGTWNAVPTKIQLFGAGVALPGDEIQRVQSTDSAVATGTTTTPQDDTIPQNTEGTQFMSQAITPQAACNLLDVESEAQLYTSAAGSIMTVALHQDSTANALFARAAGVSGATPDAPLAFSYQMRADTVSATTFKVRVGPHSAATVSFNGHAGTRNYGGVCYSFLRIREIMG